MSDAVAAIPATPTPKKPGLKKILAIAITILALLGVGNHFTLKWGYATVDVTLTDSSATVVAVPVELPVTDTIKIDTTKK